MGAGCVDSFRIMGLIVQILEGSRRWIKQEIYPANAITYGSLTYDIWVKKKKKQRTTKE